MAIREYDNDIDSRRRDRWPRAHGYSRTDLHARPLVMSKFLYRSVADMVMFAYALGAQRAMPTISDARAVEKFIADMGHLCDDCTPEALRVRLSRMKTEYHESRKVK